MKSARLSVFLVALMVVGAACASNSDGSAETGGALGSGGTSSVGGSTSSGGSGGDEGTGGAAGSGGAQESGGAQGTGGKQGSGGAPATGGTQGRGGSQGSGGTTATDAGLDLPAKDDAPTADTVRKDAQDSTSDGGRADTQGGEAIRSRRIETRGFVFDALEAGPDDGEPVLLLHGFPDTSLEWTTLMPVLAAKGYHCLAPDQRGYSPDARPIEVDAYKYEELIADAFAFGSELGERFHVVAHDWGANVGWLMVEKDPSKIASFTAISIPHYGVWARAVYDDPAMAGYLTMLNKWMADGESVFTAAQMTNMWKAKPADQREATIAHMTQPGAMTAALNWYRASDGHKRVIEDYDLWEVDVPTLLIFGTTDTGEQPVTDTEPLMKGPYRLERPTGGHFIVDEQPQVVADEVLAQLKAYPIQ